MDSVRQLGATNHTGLSTSNFLEEGEDTGLALVKDFIQPPSLAKGEVEPKRVIKSLCQITPDTYLFGSDNGGLTIHNLKGDEAFDHLSPYNSTLDSSLAGKDFRLVRRFDALPISAQGGGQQQQSTTSTSFFDPKKLTLAYTHNKNHLAQFGPVVKIAPLLKLPEHTPEASSLTSSSTVASISKAQQSFFILTQPSPNINLCTFPNRLELSTGRGSTVLCLPPTSDNSRVTCFEAGESTNPDSRKETHGADLKSSSRILISGDEGGRVRVFPIDCLVLGLTPKNKRLNELGKKKKATDIGFNARLQNSLTESRKPYFKEVVAHEGGVTCVCLLGDSMEPYVPQVIRRTRARLLRKMTTRGVTFPRDTSKRPVPLRPQDDRRRSVRRGRVLSHPAIRLRA
jgi:hypothetical protein